MYRFAGACNYFKSYISAQAPKYIFSSALTIEIFFNNKILSACLYLMRGLGNLSNPYYKALWSHTILYIGVSISAAYI